MKFGRGRKLLQFSIIIFMLLCMIPFSVYAEDTEQSSSENTEEKVVRVSVGMNNALYIDDNGSLAGYCAYFIQQLAYVNGWKLEYVEGSWGESVDNLLNGTIDLLLPAQKMEDRMDTMAFSAYIGGYQPIALFAKDGASIYYNEFDNFNGKKIAISEGSSNEELLQRYASENNFTYEIVYIDSIEGKCEALQNGSVDMIVLSTLNDIPNAKIVSVMDFLPFYYCTRVDDTELIYEVNTGMRTILSDNPTVASSVYESVLKGFSPVSFTKEENELIQRKEVVRIGVYEQALPISGSDEEGNPIGIYVDLMKAIEEKSGLIIEPVLIKREQSLYGEMDKGTVDFVMASKNMAYIEEDVSKYMCSESIMDYVTVAITRSNYSFDDKDTPRFILTKTRKYWEDTIRDLFPNAIVAYVDSVKDCLIYVQDGKADVTLMNTWEYNYQSKNERFSGMVEWESLRMQNDLVFGVKKGEDPILMSIIEKSIDRLSSNEKDAIVASNLNMKYSSYTFADYWYKVKTVVLIVTIIILIALLSSYMYFRMRKKHTKELEKKNRELEESNEAKNIFLSRMSHELRTPLNAIEGYTTVMEQNMDMHKNDEKSEKSYLESIHNAVKYQLSIIGDLLDIQKITSGRIQLNQTEIDVEDYLGTIVTMMEPEANEKEIHFGYEKISNIKNTYLMDGTRLQQVLLNLLHNSFKFTSKGGTVRLSVEEIETADKTNTLRFVVLDNGIGMSEEFQQKYLFKRFAQEYNGNTSPYEGCGTGLALSNEIVHAMKGSIHCDSKQGEGTIFTVTIPVKPLHKKKEEKSKIDYTLLKLDGIRVLLCEDNKMNQDVEKRLLEKMNCIVDIANDGKIAIDVFSNSSIGYYDIVLMDIRMPNMDGLEATRVIRALQREDAKTVPIIAVSANSFEEDIRDCLDAGMNEHIAKPVNIKVMYEKIHSYVKEKQA